MADKGDSGGDGWTKVGAKKEGLASEAAAPPSAASPLDLEAYAAMYDLDRRAVSRLRTAPADMREAIIANSFEGIRNRSAWVLTTLALMHRLGAPRFDDARVEAAIADNDIGATSTWIFRAAPKDSQAKILAAGQYLSRHGHAAGLHDVLASWYYAGYYLGRYHGEQEAAESKS